MGIDVWVPRAAEKHSATDVPPAEIEQDSWETLYAEMLACQQCELSQSRQQVLIGSGNQQALNSANGALLCNNACAAMRPTAINILGCTKAIWRCKNALQAANS
jgi:DNA-binding transcriptional MocR family regulator